jgi:tRNA(Ile)-lysidine synthase
LRVEALRALSRERMKNLLRFAIDRHGWLMPDTARLEEAVRQAIRARRDRQVVVNLRSCELRVHRGRIHLLPVPDSAGDRAPVSWRGEDRIVLPGGVLTMARTRGAGMSAARLDSAPVTIRPRIGGERLQPHESRPRRTLKNLLQEADVPAWRRERLPLIYCGDALVCVPGVGIEWRFRAGRGEPSILPSWREFTPGQA